MYMQMITEVLLDIENVLNGGQIGKIKDDYEDECFSNSSEDYSDDEMEDYLHCQNARK